MTEKTEIIQRWDRFLRKMEERFDQSLQQAEDACLEHLIATNYDYYTVILAWQGMKSQIYNLIKKIEQTWDDKVKPEMEKYSDLWTDEVSKLFNIQGKLNIKLTRFERILQGKLSQQFYDHAIQTTNQHFKCTQCHAELEIKKDLFRTQYITCTYCNAVNTFEADCKFSQIGWGIIDNIAKHKALNEYDAFIEAEMIENEQRIEKYTSALCRETYLSYLKRFFDERIKFMPDLIKDKEKDIDLGMKKMFGYDYAK